MRNHHTGADESEVCGFKMGSIRFRPFRVPPCIQDTLSSCARLADRSRASKGILHTMYLLIHFRFVNELWEFERELDQCILYADFELDFSHRMNIIS